MQKVPVKIFNLSQLVLEIYLILFVSTSAFSQESNQSFFQERDGLWKFLVGGGLAINWFSQPEFLVSDEGEHIPFMNPPLFGLMVGYGIERGVISAISVLSLSGMMLKERHATYRKVNREEIVNWNTLLGYGLHTPVEPFIRPFLGYHVTRVWSEWSTGPVFAQEYTFSQTHARRVSSLGVGVTIITSKAWSLEYEWFHPLEGRMFAHRVFLGLQGPSLMRPELEGNGRIGIDLFLSGRAKYISISAAMWGPLVTIGKREERAKRHYNLGLRYLKAGDYGQTIENLKKATRLEPSFEEAWAHLAGAYLKKEKVEEGMQAAHQAIKLNPMNWLAHYYLGEAYSLKGNTYAALTELLKAIQLNPDFPQAHHRLGTVYLEEERLTEAIEELEKAASQSTYKERDKALSDLGGAYSLEGDYDRAIEAYSKAMELNPTSWKAHLDLAGTFAEKGLFRVLFLSLSLPSCRIGEARCCVGETQKIWSLSSRTSRWQLRNTQSALGGI